jgi:serine/threonine protein kinase
VIDYTGRVLGNYRLQRLIGKGGQASVYLGQHRLLEQQQAAIKILHASVITQPDIDAFRKEADTIAALKHLHIVRLLDFDIVHNTPFLVMDYYPAGSLRDRHPRGTPISLAQIIAYVHQVADALQYAHDHRVIHRDVKSANMLLNPHGDVVLSDFGIAAGAHSTSSLLTQDIAGTVYYMAPEQIQRQPRCESDQYALAVGVYEWLAGELRQHLQTRPKTSSPYANS